MILAGELWSKIIERLHGISGARQEDERSAEPSLIERFKLNAFLNGDNPNLERRAARLAADTA